MLRVRPTWTKGENTCDVFTIFTHVSSLEERLLKLPQFERFLTCRESVTKITGICMDFFQLELKRVHKAKTISILENGTLILNICKNPVSRKFFGLVQDSRSFSGDSKFPIYLSYYQRQLSKFESLSFLSIFLFLFDLFVTNYYRNLGTRSPSAASEYLSGLESWVGYKWWNPDNFGVTQLPVLLWVILYPVKD